MVSYLKVCIEHGEGLQQAREIPLAPGSIQSSNIPNIDSSAKGESCSAWYHMYVAQRSEAPLISF